MHPLILAITGASGAIYAVRLLEVLLASGREVHLLISPSGKAVLKQELGIEVNLVQFDPSPLFEAMKHPLLQSDKPHSGRLGNDGKLIYHRHDDFMTPPASGSFLTGGMVVCPCSGSTLSGIAHAASMNLVQRAADVHLKERRKLILVPRETPLSLIQIDNLRTAAETGAIILPASPGWYHGVAGTGDLVNFVVARILDQLQIPHSLMKRWGS
ncbi:MAG: UbiX family flavin prenyltransferase [Planctomycetales bacterium]|nr:UbiX family flavin prenyltransferase [Planctomycetales bacterium]